VLRQAVPTPRATDPAPYIPAEQFYDSGWHACEAQCAPYPCG
jgi:hypothetical protein